MKRRVFNILSAVSLVLALSFAVMWVRSYSGTDYILRRWVIVADRSEPPGLPQLAERGLRWECGTLVVLFIDGFAWGPRPFSGWELGQANTLPLFSEYYGPRGSDFWRNQGFAWREVSSGPMVQNRVWSVPAWLPVALL